LAAWWDASDSNTLTTVSGAVSEWRSKYGSARVLSQSTAANRPLLTANYYGSLSAVTFDGTNDSLSGSSFASLSLAPITVIFCIDSLLPNTSQDRGVALFSSSLVASSYNNDGGLQLVANSAGRGGTRRAFEAYARSSSGGLELETTELATAHPVGKRIFTVTADGSASTLHQSGALVDSQPATVSTNTDRVYFGSLLETNPSLFWNGRILEVLVYTQAISASQRQKAEGYLAWKWGLQATLPYDHPYAASFPGYGTQATPSDADALAYLSAVRTADGGTGVEVGVANAVDSFVKGCKSDGTWSAIKASCILAGARTLSGALVPLAGTAPTNNNFVAADYNRKTGLVGNGSTKYLNSNRLDNADSLNDVHLSTYVSAVTSAFKMYGGTQSHYIYRDNTDVYFLSRNATAIVGSSGSLTGLYGHSRAASGSFTSRVGGTTNTHSVASGLATGTNVYVFGRNVSDAINSASNGRLAFYSIGSSLDLALLDTRVSALYTAIGAAI
jgi:hypothetical protein